MGVRSDGKVALMPVSWQWPWAAAIAAALALAAVALALALSRRRRSRGDRVFSLGDDLNTERASTLFRRWRALSRLAVALLVAALALAGALAARPSQVASGEERSSTRDIVLCLDVSGSALPYDRQVIDTYLELVDSFAGERIGLSIFNSTSRTVFPLTDDYDLVTEQLRTAHEILGGVESQDDIDAMSDEDYQRIADWLEGTQNRTNATSLIGDGLVSCAAMLPGFAYGASDAGSQRPASIVLATDNVVSGEPTYTLEQALELTDAAGIDVDGLYSGPQESEGDDEAVGMRTLIESRGGVFLTQTDDASVEDLVREINRRQAAEDEGAAQSALVDAPGWWTLALAVAVAAWLVVAWRLRR